MMTKQTIEIDVPEGYEIELISKSALNPGKETPYFDITVYFKKKEPEFIEVREYLKKFSTNDVHRFGIGIIYKDSMNNIHALVEEYEDFIKWIDQDWRKIYI